MKIWRLFLFLQKINKKLYFCQIKKCNKILVLIKTIKNEKNYSFISSILLFFY